MITITLSEDGRESHSDGGAECHTAEAVVPIRVYGERRANIVRLILTPDQATELLVDLVRQIDQRG